MGDGGQFQGKQGFFIQAFQDTQSSGIIMNL